MKAKISISVWMCLLICLCSLHAWPQTDEVQIWKNEEAYMNFLKNGDSAGMMSLWNENGVGWPMATPQPFSDKESRKAYLEELFTQTEVVSLKIKPGAIKIFGDAAVVHYLVDWIARDPEGNEEKLKTRITHTWMKQDGKWKIIGGMSSEYAF